MEGKFCPWMKSSLSARLRHPSRAKKLKSFAEQGMYCNLTKSRIATDETAFFVALDYVNAYQYSLKYK